jgi:N-acylneuraminate cytidylyltransferase/CMP-N,N'-diacetyllegionaminic acid synthase
VVPARRNSKRIPEKNLAPLAGRPMLVYTVEAALESGVFDRVVVSSEDGEIRELAARCGAEPHERPEELAGDLVSATDVCLEAHEAQSRRGEAYDAIVCLQPSSPLRTAADVTAAWETFLGADADFLVSVTPIDPHNFHWAVRRGADGWWEQWFGDEFMVERPLLPPVHRPNGAVKIGRVDPLAERRNFFGPRLAAYEMPEERSLHVAEPFDLALAEWLISAGLR